MDSKITGNQPIIPVFHLSEYIARQISKPDPVILEYSVRADVQGEKSAQVWDIEIDVEDSEIKKKMEAVLESINSSILTKTILESDDLVRREILLSV